MSLSPIAIKPGIYTEAADRDALERYKAGLNMRSYKGFMEKVKGWAKFVSDSTFVGICRALLSWSALDTGLWLALGTHLKLYVYDGSAYFDVTPLAASGTLANNPFTTTNASTAVSVAHVAHGLVAGQYVHFAGSTAVGGLDPNGAWVVDSITTVDAYVYQHTSVATSGATGGGAAVTYQYEIAPGTADSVLSSGWGAASWGSGTYGTPRVGLSSAQCRTWSLANWGEDMIANPYRGGIYIWDESVGAGTRAQIITNAPAQALGILVTEIDRILVAFGVYDATLLAIDPMLIKWSDSEDYTNWTASSTSSAGSKRLDKGREIIAHLISRGAIVIITDKSLYTMSPTPDQFIFDVKGEGDTVGAVSPNCAVDIGGIVYYMGRGQFFTFSGQLERLDCDVLSFVFTVDADRGFLGLNTLQAAKIYCTRNKTRNEVIWFYCSAASDEIDRCVGYSYEDKTWWLGSVARTAYLDENVYIEEPIAAGADGYLYIHESGVDADGAALSYSLETYDMEVGGFSYLGQNQGAGELIIKVRRLLPNFRRCVGNHTMTLSGRKTPDGSLMSKPAVTFNSASAFISRKIRARQISVKIEGSTVGCDISLGEWRLDAQPMGKR